jgi:hypothetical protein
MNLKTLYYGLLCLCLVTLLLRYKRLPKYCLWFIPIIALGFITELLKGYFESVSNVIQRVYQAIECLLLLLFYNSILNNLRNKKAIKICYVLFLVVTVCYYVFYKRSFNIKDYFDFIVEAFIIVILVVLFFFELLDYTKEINLLTYSAFWINAVNLIFYAGSFFAMAAYERISKSNSGVSEQLRNIPYYLNLLLYAAYAIIFAKARK